MKLRNKILLGILAILIALVAFNYKLVRYGIEQGLGQLEMVRNAVPIDDLLADPEYPDSLKQKLLLIKEIRRYAIDSLHLTDSKNYNAVYDLKGRPTAYVVQACEKYRIKKYLWDFPVVGKLPYKGFFDEEDAKKEVAWLEKKGYDTRIAHPSGWSTMGWFTDPVLSTMLRRSEGELAELIIHELTHSTVFVKNNSELNENIADYVGENGAKLYLASKYGDTSAILFNYSAAITDNERMAMYFLRGAHKLDSMYQSADFIKLPDNEKDTLKCAMIQDVINNVDTVNFLRIKPQRIKDGRLKNINNTFFTGYMTYYNRKDSLRDECQRDFGGDFMQHLESFKNRWGR
ncbi:MAG: aminopeptidase [Bacteroidales bacterium]|jgi:predicted aminopeptidase|nr:aminopeptidase [Bacteroidales bacterium]